MFPGQCKADRQHLFVSVVANLHSERKSVDPEGAQLKPQRKSFITGQYFTVKNRLDSDPGNSV